MRPAGAQLGDGELYDTGTRLPIDVIAWRRHQLSNAGYPDMVADRLAADRTVDLHQAVLMLEQGCPADLAERILT